VDVTKILVPERRSVLRTGTDPRTALAALRAAADDGRLDPHRAHVREVARTLPG